MSNQNYSNGNGLHTNQKFWLQPPYFYLVSPHVHPKDVWSIDLRHLLPEFLDRLLSSGEFNFVISANAIYSSAYLHRLKSEHLFEKKENHDEHVDKLRELYAHIPPVPIGFRPIKRKINLDELAFSLRDVVRQVLERQQRHTNNVIEEVPRLRDFKLVSTLIEENIIKDAENIINGKLPIPFSSIVKNREREYIILLFTTLLSLMSERRVFLWQPDGNSDFYICPPDFQPPDMESNDASDSNFIEEK